MKNDYETDEEYSRRATGAAVLLLDSAATVGRDFLGDAEPRSKVRDQMTMLALAVLAAASAQPNPTAALQEWVDKLVDAASDTVPVLRENLHAPRVPPLAPIAPIENTTPNFNTARARRIAQAAFEVVRDNGSDAFVAVVHTVLWLAVYGANTAKNATPQMLIATAVHMLEDMARTLDEQHPAARETMS
jgi:hypothetical protein